MHVETTDVFSCIHHTLDNGFLNFITLGLLLHYCMLLSLLLSVLLFLSVEYVVTSDRHNSYCIFFNS